MSSYIPDFVIDEVEELKELGKFDEAMRIINQFLTKNPSNEDALLQVADIQYRSGDISKATKAIDFLNAQKNHEDPLGLYIKGVLEMEKNHWLEAKKYLQQALEFTNAENHEIIRCYGLCEYWYGNREKGIKLLKEAFSMHNMDAEVIYNLIEIYLLEQKFKQAKTMIAYFYKHHEHLETLDKGIEFYEHKITLFDKYLSAHEVFEL
jgi:uncharacterized protein HemY